MVLYPVTKMKKMNWPIIILIWSLLIPLNTFADNDYEIYTIVQKVKMSRDQKDLPKDYYINMGKHQGLSKNTILNVYRGMTKNDAYNGNRTYNYQIKIGEIRIIHTEENTAIGRMVNLSIDDETPLFELNTFMIGDKVEVKINNI